MAGVGLTTNLFKILLKISENYDVLVHAKKKCRHATPIFSHCLCCKHSCMKQILILILTCSYALAPGQEVETRDVAAFTGVKVAEGIEVYLKKGEKESVRVRVTGTDPSNVITEVSGSYLRVHMRSGGYMGRVDAKVDVTYVEVDKLSASSAGTIYSETPLEAGVMEISCSSAGTIEISLRADRVECSASSAGDMELQGRVGLLIAEVSSAGEIDADDLEADEVQARASSGGSVKVFAIEKIEAHASSGGSVRYRGNPERQNNSSSSGGSVKHAY